MTFFDSLITFAAWNDADLATPWTYRERARSLRFALYRSLEEEQEAVAALSTPASEAVRIITLAQAAFGDLRGLLAGIPDDLMDKEPGPDEWSVRRTLQHTLHVERLYRTETRYGDERAESEPVQMPTERRPELSTVSMSGTRAEIVDLFERDRAETDAYVVKMTDAALSRPTVWGQAAVDARFRLHRYASHYTEHTVQCATTIDRLGFRPGDAPRIVREISRMRGLHERTTSEQTLAAMNATLAERASLVPKSAYR